MLPLEEVRAADTALAGGKGANLGDLMAAGFPVPAGFVVLSHAGHAFFETIGVARDVDGLLQSLSPADLALRCSSLQRRILEAEIVCCALVTCWMFLMLRTRSLISRSVGMD